MKKNPIPGTADVTFALERAAEAGRAEGGTPTPRPCPPGRADAEFPPSELSAEPQPVLGGKTNYERNETSSTLMDAPWLPATRGRRGHRAGWGAGAIVAVLRAPNRAALPGTAPSPPAAEPLPGLVPGPARSRACSGDAGRRVQRLI